MTYEYGIGHRMQNPTDAPAEHRKGMTKAEAEVWLDEYRAMIGFPPRSECMFQLIRRPVGAWEQV